MATTRFHPVHLLVIALWLLAATTATVCAQESEDNTPMLPGQRAGADSGSGGTGTGGSNNGELPEPAPDTPGTANDGTGGTGGTGTEAPDDRLPGYWTRGESEVPLPIDSGESQWDESGGSYDIDYLNPLRYVDLAIDFSMTEINKAINDLIKNLEEPETNRFRLFGRFRFRWEDQNDYDFDNRSHDHAAFYRDGWLAGATLTLDVLEFNASMHHVTGRRIDSLEDVYDAHQINVVFNGFEGDAIRFPVDFLDTWVRLVGYVGRGPMTLGRGRLIGSDDWDIRGNNFDSIVVSLVDTSAGGGLSLFAMQPVNYVKGFNANGHEHTLSGVALIGVDPFGQNESPDEHLTRVLLRPNEFDMTWFPVVNPRERRLATGFDIYALWLYERSAGTVGEVVPDAGGTATTGRVNLFTWGARAGIVYEDALLVESEVAVQTGVAGGMPVLAYMVHAEIVASIDWAVPMAISGIFDLASGDNDPHDGKAQGFNTLFPASHGRITILDFFAPRNLMHYGAHLSVQVAGTVNLTFSTHILRSVTPNDHVYGPGRDEIRLTADGSGSESRELGIVIAGTFEYHYSPRIHVRLGFAQLFPGKRFTRRGLGSDALLLYVGTDIRF